MSGIKDGDEIEALRKRLYERGQPSPVLEKHQLSDPKPTLPTDWTNRSKPQPAVPVVSSLNQPINPTATAHSTPPVAVNHRPNVLSTPASSTTSDMPKKKMHYRLKILGAGLVFFVVALLVSSLVLMFGNNTISGENIILAVQGPFTIGGGETMPIQVGITNDNAVPMQSATLIVEYPRGTLSAGEDQKELTTERLPLQSIAAGETLNIPLRAVVFGEENEEKEVKVSIEYRVEGSNARFFKEAEPLRFKITSSPVVLTADTLKKISSGQGTEVKVTVKSNSQSELTDVMVLAEYPVGFDFTSANPSPETGSNVWIIKSLKPEESATITIKGLVVGKESDEYAINFSVGVADKNDPQVMASVFDTAQTQFAIENPFLDIVLEMAGETGKTVIVEPGDRSSVNVEVTNTLPDAIYDIVAEVKLSGNALSDLQVGPPTGFYDSTENKIIWDVSNAPMLEELKPGGRTRLTFSIAPDKDTSKTPEIKISVNIKARRVSESQVAETLVGTAEGIMKVATIPKLQFNVTHGIGAFPDSGPVPPKADTATTYNIGLVVQNGTNDLTDTVVTTVLPTYVTWLGKTEGSGSILYDQIKRTVTWNAGNIDANKATFASFQVSVTPSKLQINTAPTIVQDQHLKANDRFTGTVVRVENPAVTTEMSTETGQEKGNGRVTE